MRGFIESAITHYILKRRKPLIHHKLSNIIESTEEFKLIQLKVCPFCGRSFKSFTAISVHLTRYNGRKGCSLAFKYYVDDILFKYKQRYSA